VQLAKALTARGRDCPLEELGLSWNRIQNKGAVALAEALEAGSLSELDLDNNMITEMGMIRLARAVATSSSKTEHFALQYEKDLPPQSVSLDGNWGSSDIAEMAVRFWMGNFQTAMKPTFTLLETRGRVGRRSALKRLPNDMLRLVGGMFATSLYQEALPGDDRYISRRDEQAAEVWEEDEVAEMANRPDQNRDPPLARLVELEAQGLDASIRRTVGHFERVYERDPRVFELDD
jgi:hypothetical protein